MCGIHQKKPKMNKLPQETWAEIVSMARVDPDDILDWENVGNTERKRHMYCQPEDVDLSYKCKITAIVDGNNFRVKLAFLVDGGMYQYSTWVYDISKRTFEDTMRPKKRNRKYRYGRIHFIRSEMAVDCKRLIYEYRSGSFHCLLDILQDCLPLNSNNKNDCTHK